MELHGDVGLSYAHQVEYMVRQLIAEDGANLYSLVDKTVVQGETLSIPFNEISDIQWKEGRMAAMPAGQIAYSRRILQPREFGAYYQLYNYDLLRQAVPDTVSIARQVALKANVFLDEIVLYGKQGMGGLAGLATQQSNSADLRYDYIQLPVSQYVPYNDVSLGHSTEIDNDDNILYGLNASKIEMAGIKLRENKVYGPLYCVASAWALGTARADPRLAKLDWNVQPSMATGVNSAYDQISLFRPCESVKKGVPSVIDANMMVQHAYVFSPYHVLMGVLAAGDINISFKPGDFGTQFNPLIWISGNYDCLRLQEKGVVCIEVKQPGGR
jgi:hypothetical protein